MSDTVGSSSRLHTSNEADLGVKTSSVLPWHPIARFLRCSVIGSIFGLVGGFSSTISPIFRRGFYTNRKNKQGQVLVAQAMGSSFIGSFIAYGAFVDRGLTSDAWMPRMNPLLALVPGLGALTVCHLLYPGHFIVLYEPTWRIKVYEYLRLTAKTVCATGSAHVPFTVVVSLMMGLLLWPASS